MDGTQRYPPPPALRAAFIWGYGHLLLFSSAAAGGAGLSVAVDHATHHAEIRALSAGAAVALPAALYLLSLWALHERPRAASWVEATVLLIMLTPFSGQPVLLTGLLLGALLVIKLVGRHWSARYAKR